MSPARQLLLLQGWGLAIKDIPAHEGLSDCCRCGLTREEQVTGARDRHL